jgi:hypothetical protein
MAEYVRLRVTAAKAGVTMALLALIGGLAERSRAATPARARQASALNFLKLKGLSRTISGDFLKIEKKFVKLDSAISGVEKKLVKFERSASSTFLKITDANAKFLKADGTAANAAKLGGLTADAFFQGKGNVVSGAVSKLGTGAQQLLSLPGGIIVVSISHSPGGPVTMTIDNATGGTLTAVGPKGGQVQTITLSPGNNTVDLLPAVQDSQFQIFPSAGFPDVVSILIGLNQVGSDFEAVAQAFTGGV